MMAALQLFQKKGYTRTSIQEIAAKASVSGVSIYHYFGNKEGVVKACAGKLLQRTTEKVMALLKRPLPFKEKLLQAVTTCSEEPAALFARYFSQEALTDAVFVSLLQEGLNAIRLDILATFIESGKAEGEIDSHLSTAVILQVLGAVATVQLAWKTPEEHRQNSKTALHLLLYGLIGRA